MENIILNNHQIEQKIDRMAYQILEDNMDEQEIVFVGIANRGVEVAQKIKQAFNTISNIPVKLIELKIDKHNSQEIFRNSYELGLKENDVVILIDDVLNTGETLMHAAYIILKANVKKLRTAVLVDRRHRKFPIKADFAGLTLSTTLEDHIEVESNGDQLIAYLQ